jgi:hypothetical protein
MAVGRRHGGEERIPSRLAYPTDVRPPAGPTRQAPRRRFLGHRRRLGMTEFYATIAIVVILGVLVMVVISKIQE